MSSETPAAPTPHPAAWLRQVGARFFQARVPHALFFAFLLFCVAYRARVYFTLRERGLSLTGMLFPYGKFTPLVSYWQYLNRDLYAAGSLLLAAGFVAVVWGPPRRAGRLVALVAADVLLAVLALATLAHFHLLFDFDAGLSWSLISQATREMGVRDIFGLVPRVEWLALLAPILFFHGALLVIGKLRRALPWLYLVLIIAGVAWPTSLRPRLPGEWDIAWPVVENPVRYAASASRAELKRKQLSPSEQTVPAQTHSLAFVDPDFVVDRPAPPAPTPPAAATAHPWNVLLFVLESTGADYVFDTSFENPPPMPFLQWLSERSLRLPQHYSSSCNSSRANFSIYTGLYASPEKADSPVMPGTNIPMFSRSLEARTSLFLVTPIRSTYVFPKGLLNHNGWPLFDRESIPRVAAPDLSDLARNEIDSTNYLIDQVDHATTPFAGIYVSYLSHFPYEDYGPEYRICAPEGDGSYRRMYYNNLRAMDRQLQRVYDHLQATDRLQNTILLVVGDHGEAFGQHRGVITHNRGTFGEIFRVPALIYQPELYPAGDVPWRTSHVDLAPTLLDGMGRTFDPAQFQGESILRGPPRRKYIFMMDSGDYLAALDSHGVKVSMALLKTEEFAYDLQADPTEEKRLSADVFPVQRSALRKFRAFQPSVLHWYQALLREKPAR